MVSAVEASSSYQPLCAGFLLTVAMSTTRDRSYAPHSTSSLFGKAGLGWAGLHYSMPGLRLVRTHTGT